MIVEIVLIIVMIVKRLKMRECKYCKCKYKDELGCPNCIQEYHLGYLTQEYHLGFQEEVENEK